MELEQHVQKTADLMGRIVKKPPLTAKLLSKPPFRYLYDLVSELMRVSNFAQGLYTPEEAEGSAKDKESKIAYLGKIISVVAFSTGVQLKANPAKIVAGLDPEDTNVFLQVLAKAVLKKVDASSAVTRVLAGERLKPGARRKSTSGSKEKLSDSGSKEKLSDSGSKEKLSDSGSKERLAPSSAKQGSLGSASRSAASGKKSSAKSSSVSEEKRQQRAASSLPRAAEVSEETTAPPRPPLDNAAPAEPDVPPANGLASNLKRLARPASARPPPPKIRASSKITADTGPMAAAPVIFTEADDSKQEDDSFVVIAAVDEQVPSKGALDDGGDQDEGEDDEKHGGLVRKILANKMEMENRDPTKDAVLKEEFNKLPKEKQIAKREIDALRESIQRLCQSTNPLGKTLDYIQEDVDGMNKELDVWKRESQKWKNRLEEEIKITIEELSPWEMQLKELEDQLVEAQGKISCSKATVMQNEGAIQKLMRDIMRPSR
ncbi:MAG: hypothetical protein SGCHY_000236 [Lobulomycetales sp.]